jgi:heme-degrading monooxygenase HmoA
MIARIWHGWTTTDNADEYEALLRAEILPGIHRVDGYGGAYLLRQDPDGADGEVEFVTITLWDSVDALREFAGDDYEVAVVPPAAREVLARFDERSAHYETLLEPTAS